MTTRHLLSIADLTSDEVGCLLERATQLKQSPAQPLLAGRTLALVFEKPSLRTRVSLDVAMAQLGGHSVYLPPAEVGLGQREEVCDIARVLSGYVDAIAARTFAHRTVELLAEYASVPVINALSDWEHPCQALADLLTIAERMGRLRGIRLAYIGDGNNVARSLLLAACLTGIKFSIASPEGYLPEKDFIDRAEEIACCSGSTILCTDDPQEAVANADVVYTDVWTSMGQEAEREERRRLFSGFQVNGELLALAKPGVIVMHPLPAHRGEEITAEVMESPQSAVFQQAANRLHTQKALLAALMQDPQHHFCSAAQA
ncbi:MAG: ornithine carbamoyltransferase [Chloroflexi bacterium]|nr:ornithine carbamoyltransferase [Chloroflexota bacterium]